MKLKYGAEMILLWACLALAAPDGSCSDEKDAVEATAGIRGYYSSGISERNIYYKGFGRVSWLTSIFDVSAEGAWLKDYQVTDGLGTYGTVDFGRGGGDLILSLPAGIDLGGGCYYSRGESGYRALEFNANAQVNVESFFLTGNYNRKNERYDMSGTGTETGKYDYTAEAGYLPADYITVTAGYTFTNVSFSILGYDYSTRVGRLGVSVKPVSYLFLSVSGGIGRDSSDYTITGGSLGARVKLFSLVRILLLCDLEYYSPPASEESSIIMQKKGYGTGVQGGGGGKYNPYLQSGSVGASYYSAKVVLGISVVF